MGQTVGKSAQFQEALELFNDTEKEQMIMLFRELCSRSGEPSGFHEDSLNALSGAYLSQQCVQNLFYYMLKIGKSSDSTVVTEEQFVITIVHALKGSLEETSKLLISLCSAQVDRCTFGQLQQVLKEFGDSLLLITESSAAFNTWAAGVSQLQASSKKLVRAWLHPLLASKKLCQAEATLPPDEREVTVDVVEKWLQQSSMLLMTMKATLQGVFPINSTSSLGTTLTSNLAPPFPYLSIKSAHEFSELLDILSILYLNYHLPIEFRQEWCLLFSSSLHGESFFTMCSKIVDRGPCLFVLRDKEGNVFGGFTGVSINAGPKFKGTTSCFLYQIHPYLEVYHTTGLNENYFYYNVHQQTMPNGMGFGGQLDYFGLWLSEDYGKGHSKAGPKCTTYGSPQLSKSSEFYIDVLEVWRVGIEKKPLHEELGQPAPGSILDQDPGAKAMLSLIDRGPVSEGLRESDATASNPEEQTLEKGPYL